MISARIAAFLKENGWVLNIIFIVLGAYFVAGATNAVVARSIRVVPSLNDVAASSSRRGPSSSSMRKTMSAIADRNLVGAKREALTPVAQTIAAEAGQVSGRDYNEADLKPCTMPAAVRATLVAEGAPKWSMAVIYNNSSRETGVFSINTDSNQITDDAVLVDVRSREVVVRRRDRFELCTCEGDDKKKPGLASRVTARASDPGGGITKVSETQYTIARSEVDNALSNLSQVATQARIVPSFKNGKPNGFKLFSIKPGSIYSKIGLKNGDVIQKINGYEMNSPDKALEIYQKLKDATSVSIELQRRGQTKHFSYAIQ